ncbi:hypothetical protein [Roseospira goensis]|uniref:Lipoprotein n=1 Tax=Roseospira goensis TaxID=391922 RepID=A0A7W6S2J0_9PROT|nr:hypothetical protein [Roseospira goensis]MBB4287215.1 hypothetical protein [Roseospira goensis]
MPRSRLAAVLLALAPLAACGSGGPGAEMDDATHLTLYCQTHRCVCVEDGFLPFGAADKREPEWSLTGEPSCLDGYTLDTVTD